MAPRLTADLTEPNSIMMAVIRESEISLMQKRELARERIRILESDPCPKTWNKVVLKAKRNQYSRQSATECTTDNNDPISITF